MEQTASSKSVLNVIFRALRRRPVSIPPAHDLAVAVVGSYGPLLKKKHEGDENEDELQHKI